MKTSDFVTGPEVVAFVAALDPGGAGGAGYRSPVGMGFLGPDGAVEAGVLFHEWMPERRMIEMSCAATSRRWMTWPRARAIFAYPFQQLGCDLVFARSEHPVIHRTFRLLGGEITPTPVWTIVTLSKEQWHARQR